MPVNERMRGQHRQFLGVEYLCHVLPSAVPQPVHAVMLEPETRSGQPNTAVVACASSRPGACGVFPLYEPLPGRAGLELPISAIKSFVRVEFLVKFRLMRSIVFESLSERNILFPGGVVGISRRLPEAAVFIAFPFPRVGVSE